MWIVLFVLAGCAENIAGQSPSVSDLQKWATYFELSHPVLADVDFYTTANYLWATEDFNGNLYLPNMQLLSEGMVIEISNSQMSNPQIISYIQ